MRGSFSNPFIKCFAVRSVTTIPRSTTWAGRCRTRIPQAPTNPKFEQYHSGRLFVFYENKFTPYASFAEGLELIEPFNHPDAFRLNSLTSLSSQLYKMVAVKLNFKLAYNNDPPLRPNAPIDPTTSIRRPSTRKR